MKIIKKITKLGLGLIFIVLAIVLGYFTGTQINGKYFKIDKFQNLARENFTDDVSAIDYKNKKPDDLTPTETYLISLSLSTSKDYYKKTLAGVVDTSAGITQYVDSFTIKNGNNYSFKNSTYSPMVKFATRCSYIPGEILHIEKGELNGKNLDDITWTGTYEDYSYEDYSQLLGRDPTDECTYIVSSKTVLDSCLIKKDNGLYTYKISIDPTYGTFTYINEIAYNTGIDKNTISFNSVEFEFTVDSNFNFLEQHCIEKYSLKYSGIPVNVTATYDIKITY